MVEFLILQQRGMPTIFTAGEAHFDTLFGRWGRFSQHPASKALLQRRLHSRHSRPKPGHLSSHRRKQTNYVDVDGKNGARRTVPMAR